MLTFPTLSLSIAELRNLASALGSGEFRVCCNRARSRVRLTEVGSGTCEGARVVERRAIVVLCGRS